MIQNPKQIKQIKTMEMEGRPVKNTFNRSFSQENRIKNASMISQYVSAVFDFSSQYGSDSSISYTAYNLTGKPSNFPDYGDFPQNFFMKTYGNWWKDVPSCSMEYMPQNNPTVKSQDYVGTQKVFGLVGKLPMPTLYI